MDRPHRPIARQLRGAVLATALAASVLGAPALAGQASTSFNVTINYVAAPTSCTASVGSGVPLVQCGPVPTGQSAPGPATAGTTPSFLPGTPPSIITAGSSASGAQDALRFRLPDTRMKVAGALVEVGEESFHAWGEYSSRIIAAGGVEYVEMTVTW